MLEGFWSGGDKRIFYEIVLSLKGEGQFHRKDRASAGPGSAVFWRNFRNSLRTRGVVES